MSKLYCIWEISPVHIVMEISGGRIVNEYRTECPPCSFGVPRGGTQPIDFEPGTWIRFFHANLVNQKSDAHWNYSLGALVMQNAPPFRILNISKQPILAGNEMFNQDPHHKPKCILPYGAVRNGDGFEVGVGLNDCQCAIAYINKEHLNL